MLVAWLRMMAVSTGRGGQGRAAGRPRALHSVSVFLLHNPPGVPGHWTFPGTTGTAHRMLVIWLSSSRPPPDPALGANPSSPRTRPAPVTLLQSPHTMPGLACGPQHAVAPVPASSSPLGCSLHSPLGQKLTSYLSSDQVCLRGRALRVHAGGADMSPGSVIIEKYPKVTSFLGKFPSDPASVGVEQADCSPY